MAHQVPIIARYVLLRLDERLSNNPGVSYTHRIITVEHVLPQNPSAESQWVVDFTDAERLHWTHRLGNLLLLNRNKNSQAQNVDFVTKKEKYFSPAAGVTGFALTTLVLSESAWTPDIVEQRQKDLVGVLAEEWSL